MDGWNTIVSFPFKGQGGPIFSGFSLLLVLGSLSSLCLCPWYQFVTFALIHTFDLAQIFVEGSLPQWLQRMVLAVVSRASWQPSFTNQPLGGSSQLVSG